MTDATQDRDGIPLRRPEDFDDHHVQLPGVKIHYVREGSGPPLLLLHGWPGFWWDWRNVIGPLAEDFDVIVPDFRGAGDSEKPDLSDPSQYSVHHITDDQAAFLDALGIEQAYVVGHDYGATVTHKLLRKYPERVTKAVIFDPITPHYGPAEADELWFALFHQYDAALELITSSRDTVRVYYKHFFDHWSYRTPLLSEEELEVMVDNYMKPGNVHGGINYDRANLVPGANQWTDEDHNVYDGEVTMLWGAADPAVPPTGSVHLPEFYSNYTLEMVEQCGHFMMIERPDIVIDRIKRSFG